MAYENLGIDYSNLNQPSLAADYLKKAFDLRDRVTEREKFHITSLYYVYVTGELEKANQSYELWKQAYPRDDTAPVDWAVTTWFSGNTIRPQRKLVNRVALDPNTVVAYVNLGQIYLALNRFDEARTTTEEAQGRKLEIFRCT